MLITYGTTKPERGVVEQYVESMRNAIAESYCGNCKSPSCSCCSDHSDSSTIATNDETKNQDKSYVSQSVVKNESGTEVLKSLSTDVVDGCKGGSDDLKIEAFSADGTIPCTESAKLRTQQSPPRLSDHACMSHDNKKTPTSTSDSLLSSSKTKTPAGDDFKLSSKTPVDASSSVEQDAASYAPSHDDVSSAHNDQATEDMDSPEIRPSVTVEESPSPVKKRRTTGLEDLGLLYGAGDPEGMPEQDRAVYDTKCPHCGQKGKECFDEFFGPYCILAAAYHIRIEDYIPSARECSNYYRHAFFHAVHFYCYLVTKCFDNSEMEEIQVPECMLEGSFRYMLNDLRKAAVKVDKKRRDLQTDVIRSVMLFGKDYLLNEN